MHLATTGRLRRGTALLLFAVLLVTAALTLSQCRMVDERLTGVDFGKSRPANCMTKCSHAYNDSVRAESRLHVDRVHACQGEPVCKAVEQLRHESAIRRIQTGRKNCQDACHHQGGGGGH
jgi:hypothetical protein